jgi:hypothetical protein
LLWNNYASLEEIEATELNISDQLFIYIDYSIKSSLVERSIRTKEVKGRFKELKIHEKR